MIVEAYGCKIIFYENQLDETQNGKHLMSIKINPKIDINQKPYENIKKVNRFLKEKTFMKRFDICRNLFVYIFFINNELYTYMEDDVKKIENCDYQYFNLAYQDIYDIDILKKELKDVDSFFDQYIQILEEPLVMPPK